MRTVPFKAAVCGFLWSGLLCFAQQYPPQQQYAPQQPQQYPPAQYPQQQYPQQQYPPQQYPQTQQYPPAQAVYGQQPQPQSPQQLDQLVGPIALYPDGLLAQVLTASTYPEQIPDAAGWANQHAYIRGDRLADAMRGDNLQFAPSIMALLPFPQVLSYMAQNMAWTEQLANAVFIQRPDVMDAVQRMRYQAYSYGYLNDPQFTQYERINMVGPRVIEIVPVNAGYYFVPSYSPYVVFGHPRPRGFVGGVFNFGGGIQIGAAFSPWGWGGTGFGWREHNILVDNRPWVRTWDNRARYEHSYREVYRPGPGPRVEGHDYRRDDHRDVRRDERREEHHDH